MMVDPTEKCIYAKDGDKPGRGVLRDLKPFSLHLILDKEHLQEEIGKTILSIDSRCKKAMLIGVREQAGAVCLRAEIWFDFREVPLVLFCPLGATQNESPVVIIR